MARPLLPLVEGWRSGTLAPNPSGGLIERVFSGGTPATGDDENWDGDILWLTPKELARGNRGLFVTQTERKVTDKGLKGSGAKLLPVGTVLLTKRAPVGLVGVSGVPLTTNQGFLNFVCGPHLRPLYLAYWLIANRPYLDAVAIGSTYPELYIGDLFEFELAVPDVPVQDEIVDFMRSYDFMLLAGLPLEQLTVEMEYLRDIQGQTDRLKNLRVSLLRGLLSGQVVPDDLPSLAKQRGTKQGDGSSLRRKRM